MFKGVLLYTVGVLFHMEWCIRQLWCSSIIYYNINIIAYNHDTNNNISILFQSSTDFSSNAGQESNGEFNEFNSLIV